MTRFAAFGIHFFVGLVIYLATVYAILSWYPVPYFAADGGLKGAQLLFFVDLVLGPFLTLIIYKQGKPGLKFDLAVIIAVQSLAFVWGGWTVYSQRTALVVFVDDAFHSLSWTQAELAGLKEEQISAFSTSKPPMAFLDLPEEREERRKLILEYEFKKGIPMIRLGERYQPLDEERRRVVVSRAMPVEDLKLYNPNFKEVTEEFLQTYGGVLDDYAFIPIHCRYKSSVLAMRRDDASIVTMPDLQIPVFY